MHYNWVNTVPRGSTEAKILSAFAELLKIKANVGHIKKNYKKKDILRTNIKICSKN